MHEKTPAIADRGLTFGLHFGTTHRMPGKPQYHTTPPPHFLNAHQMLVNIKRSFQPPHFLKACASFSS